MTRTPMRSQVTVTACWVRALLSWAEHRGLDPNVLLEKTGVTPESLEPPDARVPFRLHVELWSRVGRSLGEPDIGLRLAEAHGGESSFGVAAYIARCSPTLGCALQRTLRYSGLVNDARTLRAHVDGEIVTVIEATPPDVDRYPPPLLEATMASLLRFAREWTGEPIAPIAVRFQHPKPLVHSRHERLFDAPVRFEQDRNELVLRRRDLELPHLHTDPSLYRILSQTATSWLDRLGRSGSLVDDVRREIARQLVDGSPELSRTARYLALSPRSLQRHLRAQGTCFQEVVDRLRRERCVELLSEGDRTTGELAYQLGYSESRAFRRAFRRWFGASPSVARRHPNGLPIPPTPSTD